MVVAMINRAFSYKRHANRLMMMCYNGSGAGLDAMHVAMVIGADGLPACRRAGC